MAQVVVSGKVSAEGPRKRRVRVGPVDDIHDVRHEAARLYRAIRTADSSDPLLLNVAPHAIGRLIILSDVVKTTDLQVRELREMLKLKANGAVR